MLAKSKLNSMEVLISKVLIDSVISHDEFILINFLKEYSKMSLYCLKCRTNTESKNPKVARTKNGNSKKLVDY